MTGLGGPPKVAVLTRFSHADFGGYMVVVVEVERALDIVRGMGVEAAGV